MERRSKIMIALGIIILALGGYLVYALIYPEKL
ncbi:K(+)-transporting ATPase subunit F [Blautia sp.]|nr:K(+)-transporting ATPase subunit F [Blautia sp.]MED9881381.1 K(+)-transporting ATPase subunit F [Blautia sp.]